MKLLIDPETRPCPNAQALCRAAAKAVDSVLPQEGVICLKLSDNKTVQRLNHQFRGKNKPTNVLSFPAELEGLPAEAMPTPPPLGDLIIAAETVITEAQQQEKTVAHHLQHLVVHGILHVYGYDHMTDEDAREMETLEVKILTTLDITNPYE